MEQRSTFNAFSLGSSSEVTALIEKMKKVVKKNLYIQVFAYMHNTVLMHNLHNELKKMDEKVKIASMPANKDADIIVHVYSYDDDLLAELENSEFSIESVLIAEYQLENSKLEHTLKQNSQDTIQHFFHDKLTSLSNLYQLRDDLEQNEQSTLIMVLIDNFKVINDYYGFMAGDFLLEAFAKTLKERCTEGTLYRTNGAQFAIRLDERMDFYSLKDLLAELSESLKHISYHYYDTIIYIDVTLGSVISNTNSNIFSKVSMALEYAKEHHLPFWIYEQRMHFEDVYETNLKASLSIRNAVMSSGIMPYFQPIVCNKTDKIVMYEALSRMQDESGVILTPNQFLPIAKKIKVYDEITKTMIEKTLATIEEGDYKVSINLSFDDIMSSSISAYIVQMLEEKSLGPRVIFELRATEAISDYDKANKFITEIKRYGAEVAIDDFGCGFSNFSYLTSLDVDYVKIDGSLIRDIEHDTKAIIVVETIVAFAKRLNLKTIAEHVHSSAALAKVKNLGIDFSQGYYIDEPTPMEHRTQKSTDELFKA